MKYILVFVLIGLVGCAGAPVHLYDTDNVDKSKLATVIGKDNEVRILEVDDKPYTGKPSNYFYLPAGKHKFKVALNWSTMSFIAGVGIKSQSPFNSIRTGCLDLKPGETYLLAASTGTNDWRLMYFENFFKKTELSSC